MTYDQADIRAEAEALVAFIEGAISGYGLDPASLTILGYSNRANLLGAVLQLHPKVIERAILLRSVQAVEDAPLATLTGAKVLMLNGASDPFGKMAPALEDALRTGGAGLDVQTLPTGHGLSPLDVSYAKTWLAG